MFSIILVAISLSMDAFSLSLCLGTLNLQFKKVLLFSYIVAAFHFALPLIGIIIGDFILKFITIETKYLVFVVFFYLGLFMLLNKDDDRKEIVINFLSLLILGFLVSIDSFISGVGINFISHKHLLCCVMFSLFSFVFTFIGLIISKKISKNIGIKAKTIGALLLIVLSIQYLTK